jgi:SH3-like domain-containing protein
MKRKLLVAIPLLIVVVIAAWIVRPKHEYIGEAYVSTRSTALLSSVAQVRQEVGELHYGEHVEVLAKRNEFVKIRTTAGTIGWVDAHQLMDPQLWQRSILLLKNAQGLPTQARGRTKVATNLRVEPGRSEARLYQFGRGIPVEVVGRATADWVQVSDEKDTAIPQETKREDWFLVRGEATRPPGETTARTGSAIPSTTTAPGDGSVPIAGWVVARFVELDVPDAVREGASSANVRPVAWFELNRVPDESGEKPQYMLAAVRGPEGQACDFTNLRVFTWNKKKTRYETAFIESNLCGALPIRLTKGPKGEPEFRFKAMDGDRGERAYRLIQTVVRRVREAEAAKKPSGAASASKKTR